MRLQQDDVLLVIDVQQDFLPGGALGVPGGDAVIAPINGLGRMFAHVILTQDWHPAGHTSFAASHLGRTAFETIDLAYGRQVLWPIHCVQATPGSALAPGLDLPQAELIIRKGYRPAVDSYSAFYEADRQTPTGLVGYLRERQLKRLFVVGLATDFCVAWSALDAKAAGFDTFVIEDCCRAIDTVGSLDRAWRSMHDVGVERLELTDLEQP